MIDFELQRCTRRCAKTERDLAPGEMFYSVLVQEGAEIQRLDYCREAWEGAPAEAVCWWKSQMPDPKSNQRQWAPSEIMLNYFERILEDPAQRDVCYILGLLMIRRKILRLEDIEKQGDGSEQLVTVCLKRDAEYRIVVATPSADRIQQIETELASMLQSGDQS